MPSWVTMVAQAASYIERCCPHAGAFHGTNDAHFLLLEFAEIISSHDEIVLGDRRREHVAFAINLAIRSVPFRPEGAVAAPYLITQVEYLLRRLCDYVDDRGKIVRELPDGLRKGKGIGDWVELGHLYKIYRDAGDGAVPQILVKLDRNISEYNVYDGTRISNLGDRLKWFRDGALHGYSADVSSESVFVGLILLILYGAST